MLLAVRNPGPGPEKKVWIQFKHKNRQSKPQEISNLLK